MEDDITHGFSSFIFFLVAYEFRERSGIKRDKEIIVNYKYIKKIPSRLWMGQFILIF
jgi:hypothetical protein